MHRLAQAWIRPDAGQAPAFTGLAPAWRRPGHPGRRNGRDTCDYRGDDRGAAARHAPGVWALQRSLQAGRAHYAAAHP